MRPKIEYKVVHNGSEYTFTSNGIELDNLVRDLASRGVDLANLTITVALKEEECQAQAGS